MPRRPLRRKPFAGRGQRMRQRAGRRPRPVKTLGQMRPRAEGFGPLRRSSLQQRAAVERRGWGRILLFGPMIEWVLNFVYRGRRHRVQRRRVIGTGLGSSFADRLRQAQRPSLPAPRNQGRLLRERNEGLRRSMALQHGRGRIRGVLKYKGKAA